MKFPQSVLLFLIIFCSQQLPAQDKHLNDSLTNYADSIPLAYKIPELAFAVLSADSIIELQTLRFQRIGTDFKATSGDRFHIGSNTKAKQLLFHSNNA